MKDLAERLSLAIFPAHHVVVLYFETLQLRNVILEALKRKLAVRVPVIFAPFVCCSCVAPKQRRLRLAMVDLGQYSILLKV